jgi:N,N'-diacetylchitobiose transport system permease protein
VSTPIVTKERAEANIDTARYLFGRRSSSTRRRRAKTPYFLIIPALAALAFGTGYPIVWQTITSFREYGLAQQFGQPAPFVGLQNYVGLITGHEFWTIVIRSVVFCVVTAAATMVLGIGVALVMRAVAPVPRVILQVALLLAWAMPVVAQMTVWTWLVDDRNGILNYMLSKIPGVDMIGHNWLVNPLSFFFVASVIIVWASVPFVAFSVYAAFTTVGEEVLEAAAIDGASRGQVLRQIILPIIRPVLAIVLLLQLIWDLRVFSQIKLLQDAGSFGSQYDLLGTYIYKLGTGSQDFGTASAAAMIVMFLTIGLSFAYVRHMLKEDAQS